MDLGIRGETALVVGASEGIGYESARSLLEEGARVFICSRSPEKLAAAAARLKESTGKSVAWLAADATRAADVARLGDWLAEQAPSLDILVSAVGGSRRAAELRGALSDRDAASLKGAAMPLRYPLVHVEDVQPENMKKGEGWAISEFRLPISGKNGSSTTLFHSIFRPGSTHAKHLHSRCDEIAVYLKGHGTVGQSGERTEVRPGHCRLMPKGSEHFFHNETKDEDGLVIGFYVGAKDVKDTGYEFRGDVTAADLKQPRVPKFKEGTLVHIDEAKPLHMDAKDGWSITDFRMPIGRHTGSSTALFWAKFMPGAVHKKHRHDDCEELYYVIRGHGLAGAGPDRAEVRGGHVHYIPKGVEHFMYNLSKTDPLEVIGVYIGAGSVEETGYVYSGDVTQADLRTSGVA